MKSKFRYVAVNPDRIEQKEEFGPASYLHDFLVDQQTDAEGYVHYRKPIGYAWIRKKWKHAPPVRTLKRHMARLRDAGAVKVRVIPMGGGMVVRIVGSVKWSPEVAFPAGAQGALFGGSLLAMDRRGSRREGAVHNSVENSAKSSVSDGAKSGPIGGHNWPRKEVRINQEEEKNINPASAQAALASLNPVEDRKPWTAEHAQKLDEFYGLKRTLAKIPLRHPRFDELTARAERLEDELGRLARSGEGNSGNSVARGRRGRTEIAV